MSVSRGGPVLAVGRRAATADARKYACARCGKAQPADRMLFSSHTRLRYCTDIVACGRRAKRVKR